MSACTVHDVQVEVERRQSPPPHGPASPAPSPPHVAIDTPAVRVNSPTYARNTDELAPSAVSPLLSDAERILSDAQRSAQSELRSTQSVLKLAGSVLGRERSGSGAISPTNGRTPRLPSPHPYSPDILRGRIIASKAGISLPPLSIQTSLSHSPQNTPPQSPTADDCLHLPGKFGSLSSAEVKKKLTASPVMREGLLKKLDGLNRVPSSSSLHSTRSGDSGDDRDNCKVTMQSAHEHANRIKERIKQHSSLAKGLPPGNSIGNDDSLSLSNLAIDQSTRNRARSPRLRQSDALDMWMRRKVASERGRKTPKDSGEHFGQYHLHPSETVISHELNRGDWTWAVEWSPDGKFLALATENHGLAVVEAGSGLVWKVVKDERMGKVKNGSTHSIRTIAWGGTFIALGGTGDAVSIVEPCLAVGDGERNYSFNVVDVLPETGFVGTLSWLKNSNILAIGNREDQCLIAEIRRRDDGAITSNVLHNIERSDWVTAVAFSHGGTKLAIGDRNGILSVYLFVIIRAGEPPALSPLQDVSLDDNILTIEWSPDGKFLYTGGEDYSITVLETTRFSVLRRIGRDRWVPFLATSLGGSYVAAGGGSSQVSLLDANNNWEEATSLPVDGMANSAAWHPHDEYLAVCGQSNDVVVYESSCQRFQKGKCLRTSSSILAVNASPDAKKIAVGNETGLVTIFDTESPALVTLYETVIGTGGEMTIRWSPDGASIAIASGSTFVLLDSSSAGKEGVHPQSSALYTVRKVIQGGASFSSLSFSPTGQYLALSDDRTQILDVNIGCRCARVLDQPGVVSSAWSTNGAVFAMVGGSSELSIYDVKGASPDKWSLLFSISFKAMITSLCWGPSTSTGIYYLAFGGENETVAILEVRTQERIWETVLQIPCNSCINALDWNEDGMLCIGDDDGSASVVDLSYLCKSGKAVSEMNYNWQRQGVISTTKLTRNFGRNAVTSACWLPSSKQTVLEYRGQSALALGGSDGIFEIVDLST
ncbi:hypothetical protein ACHAXT_000595 [Thalassiosira profunda]